MNWLFDGLFDKIKEGLIDAIMSRFVGMFDNINQQVGEIAANVGQTPTGWNV